MNKNNTSDIKGVSWDKEKKKWEAHISINGKNVHIGYLNTLKDAQSERQRVAEQNFCDFINSCEIIHNRECYQQLSLS